MRKECPIIEDVTKLRDNRFQCISVMKSVEKRLRKRDQCEIFNSQFLEYVSRGFLEEVTETHISQWKTEGSIVHYISVHDVIKPNSVSSTPVHLVTKLS